MKITKVDVYLLDGGAQRHERKPVVCRVHTDEGVYGDGEAGIAYGIGATGAFGMVKDLAAIFRMRIELRQIGVRDEAKMLNGIGICGRALCCATFLGDFQPVSIKMAKEQNLSLNPIKISGVCGRLMCCLKYEEDTYEELNRKMPVVGDIISTVDGTGEILATNVLMQMVKAAVRKKENDLPTIGFYHVDEIKVLKTKKKRKKQQEDLENDEN